MTKYALITFVHEDCIRGMGKYIGHIGEILLHEETGAEIAFDDDRSSFYFLPEEFRVLSPLELLALELD